MVGLFSSIFSLGLRSPRRSQSGQQMVQVINYQNGNLLSAPLVDRFAIGREGANGEKKCF